MKKRHWSFVFGFLLGAILFGGSAVLAAVLATPSISKIMVDGKEVKAEAYLIDGRNYLQLRDMAAAINFSAVWDSMNNQVLIDTSKAYDPNETLSAMAPIQIPAPLQTEESAMTITEEPAMTIDEMKLEIIRLTNIERVKAGVSELEILPELMDSAQAKAQDFMDNHYYGHTSPVYGTFGVMIKSFVPNAKSAAENIAPWIKTPQEVITGLMDSPDHRKNMLNPKYTHIGVGVIEGVNGGYWWVQQFAGL